MTRKKIFVECSRIISKSFIVLSKIYLKKQRSLSIFWHFVEIILTFLRFVIWLKSQDISFSFKLQWNIALYRLVYVRMFCFRDDHWEPHEYPMTTVVKSVCIVTSPPSHSYQIWYHSDASPWHHLYVWRRDRPNCPNWNKTNLHRREDHEDDDSHDKIDEVRVYDPNPCRMRQEISDARTWVYNIRTRTCSRQRTSITSKIWMEL